MSPAADVRAAQALGDALQDLHDALLGNDILAIRSASERAASAVFELERTAPPPELLAPLAALNRRAGALVAARQAAASWALSRLSADGPVPYGHDGRQPTGRAPRRIAQA